MEFDELVTLEEVTTKIGDGLHGTPKYDENGTYYFINGNNLSNGNIIFKETTKKVNEDEFKKYQKPLNDRTLFVSINGTIGNTAVYNNEDIILGKSACYLNVKNSIDKDFIYYLLNTNHFQNYIDQYATGTTIKNVSLKTIRGYKFELPSIKKQKSISIILKNIDKKIQVNQQIIANLEELSQTFFKRWFVDFEFPDEEGNPYKSNNGLLIESNVGLIPDKWKIGELKDIAHIVMGQSPKSDTYNNENEGLPLINGATDFNHGIINPTKYTTDPKKVGSQNDYIFGVRATIGRVTELDNEYAIGRGAGIASPINEFCREFLYQILNKAFKDFSNTASGSVYLNVSRNDLISYNIIIPTDDILRAFHSLTNSYLKDVSLLKLENKNLIELRDTLLPKLMSGEIELPDELEVDEHAELLQ